MGYSKILEIQKKAGVQSTLDSATETKHFGYTVRDPTGKANGRHQLWFDDPQTLVEKYRKCQTLGTHGVGFWTADMPDYTTDEGKQMWNAVDQGFPPP